MGVEIGRRNGWTYTKTAWQTDAAKPFGGVPGLGGSRGREKICKGKALSTEKETDR